MQTNRRHSLGTVNQLQPASSPSSVKVAGVDLPVVEDIKILGVVLNRHLTFDKHVSAGALVVQLPRTGDPPHTSSTDKSDPFQDCLLQRCAPRRSIPHHPQAAAGTEQRRKNRSSSAKTIIRTPADEGAALVAGGASHLLYKLAVLTFKIRHTSAPAYLSRHIRAHSGTRSLRSSAVSFLEVPFRRTDIGKRSFSCAAPATWNSAFCCRQL